MIHVLLADAQSMVKKFQQAAEEYQTALVLKPKKPDDVKVKLARAQFGAGQRDAGQGHARRGPQGRPGSSRRQGAQGGDGDRPRVGDREKENRTTRDRSLIAGTSP